MFRTISERDWKIFRELRPIALGRLCERILAEIKTEAERPGESAHAKYLRVYELIHKRDKDVANGFNEFSSSSALTQIGIIHSLGLWTADELRRFGPDTLMVVEMYGSMPES